MLAYRGGAKVVREAHALLAKQLRGVYPLLIACPINSNQSWPKYGIDERVFAPAYGVANAESRCPESPELNKKNA